MNFSYLPEIGLRSVAVYLFIILAIRLFGKKELAQLSVIDLVFILLISNLVQNTMVGNNTSLPGGIFATLALFATNFILNKYCSETKNPTNWYEGNPIPDNLKLNGISLEEIEAAALEHGVEKVGEVKLAILEVDGTISILSGDFRHKTNHHFQKTKHRGNRWVN